MKLGAKGYIIKPFKANAFHGLIARLFKEKAEV